MAAISQVVHNDSGCRDIGETNVTMAVINYLFHSVNNFLIWKTGVMQAQIGS
jgi:hypothetical protein